MKIHAVLGTAHGRRRRLGSIVDLVKAVEAAKLPAYTYFRAHPRKGSELAYCSRDLIQERVKLCTELGLIDSEDGEITKLGEDSLKGQAFGRVIARQVKQLLEERGFKTKAIEEMLRSTGELRLPTAQRLYEEAVPTVKLQEFRRLLNLLVDSGALTMVQSRIYLPSTRIS